jgi:hypothetical protein
MRWWYDMDQVQNIYISIRKNAFPLAKAEQAGGRDKQEYLLPPSSDILTAYSKKNTVDLTRNSRSKMGLKKCYGYRDHDGTAVFRLGLVTVSRLSGNGRQGVQSGWLGDKLRRRNGCKNDSPFSSSSTTFSYYASDSLEFRPSHHC